MTEPNAETGQTRDIQGLVIATAVALVVFARPWRDGLSFSGYNAYITWATLAALALWAAGLLLAPRRIHAANLVGLLAGFLLVAALTGLATNYPDPTLRGLTYWTTALAIFVLTSQALNTPLRRGLVISAFVVTFALSGLWALVHLYYVMPLVRDAIGQDQSTREYHFGVSQLPNELAHRLGVNRAFGATLFPNALAALMILGIPVMIFECIAAFLSWREDSQAQTERARPRSIIAFAWAAGIALALAGATRLLFPLLHRILTSRPGEALESPLYVPLIYMLPILIGLSIAALLRLEGYRRTWLFLQLTFLPAAAATCIFTLYKTYSRGGMLALVLAVAFVTATLLGTRLIRKIGWQKASAALLLVVLLGAAGVSAQDPQLPTQGVEADVLATESFWLRLSYWRVAARMIADNPITGVGLGGFGNAYGRYFYPNAGETKMAHNDFLQTFAETGFAGAGFFALFWATFFWTGLRQLRSASSTVARLRLAGLYTAVLAFTLHACVDFNFQNPSLGTMAIAAAGLFVARTQPDTTTSPRPFTNLIALPVLLVVALTMTLSIRIYRVDFALTGPMPLPARMLLAGTQLEIRDKLKAARFYLDQMATHGSDPGKVLYSPYARLLRIVPSHDQVATFARFANPDPESPNGFALLKDGETIGPESIAIITDVAAARNALFESGDALLADLEAIDSGYPYKLEVSMHAVDWCDLLRAHAPDDDTRRRYATQQVRWAKASVDRCPTQSLIWSVYARALWARAAVDTDPDRIRNGYDAGLDAYRQAAEFFPVLPSMWEQYAVALQKLGQGYINSGDRAAGEKLLAERATIDAHVRALQEQWANTK